MHDHTFIRTHRFQTLDQLRKVQSTCLADLLDAGKDTKKIEDKKKDTAAGGIEIYKGKNGFRYRIVDSEGKTVAMPIPNKAWETRAEVIKALDALKETLNNSKPVDVKE